MHNSILKSSRLVRLLYIASDLIICALVYYLAYIFRYNFDKGFSSPLDLPNFKEYTFIFVLWFIFILIFFKRSNLYLTDRNLSISQEILRVFLNVGYVGILISAVIFFAQFKFFSRLVFIVCLVLFCVFLSLWRTVKRIILRRLISQGFHNINVLIVGAGKVGESVLDEIKQNPWLGLKVIGFLDDSRSGIAAGVSILGKLDNFQAISKKYFIDEVIVTIPSAREIVSKLIKQAKNLSLGVNLVPENFDEILAPLNISYLGIIPLLSYKQKQPHPTEFALKSFFDFIVVLVAFILLLPLFALISILIKLDSQGPVFYVQKRVGSKGRIFYLYKFRSMLKNADKLKHQLMEKNEVRDGIIFKIKDDPRITRIGRFLRRTSLDELPQLLNVLRRDMSLVGPRPPTPDEVEKYHYTHMQRLSIKPGITGMSQVRGRSDLTFHRWAKWDIWYVNNWSFGLDLKILWWTVPTVLKGKGAY
jgi:exopolysaccharide biosynthesis polyprenyl glycosylphosphotransferase